MSSDQYSIYGVVLVAGAAVAVSAGMPVVLLLFLACPLMMFFMMKGRGGMRGSDESSALAPPAVRPKTRPVDDIELP